MTTQITLPPTRNVGDPNPPGDMNLVSTAASTMQATSWVYPTGDSSGNDDLANINAAVAAANQVFLAPGTFYVNAALNWKSPCLVVQGAGASNLSDGGTVIHQVTANTPVIEVAGQNQDIGGFTLTYASQQSSSNTNAIGMALGDNSVGSCFASRYHEINIEQAATAMEIVSTTVGGAFSCTFENFNINGYSISAMNMAAASGSGSANTTGCLFNNIYIHNNFFGTNATCTSRAVNFTDWDEAVFNQLNIEHGNHYDSDVLFFQQCGNMIVNSLHYESLIVSGSPSGWGFLTVNNGGNVIVNGMTIRSCTIDGTGQNPVVRFNTAPANVTINGFNNPASGMTITTAMPYADFGSTPDCSLVVTDVIASDVTGNYVNNTTGDVLSVGNLVASGQYLCPPNVYAPGSQVTFAVNTTTLAAFAAGTVCTNTFIAPYSGAVVVTAHALLQQSTGGDEVMLGLAATGTVTPVVGHTATFQISGATTLAAVTVPFYVTGLTAGSAYTFDLLGAAQGTATTVTMFTQGLTATTLGNRGGPAVMTVQAV